MNPTQATLIQTTAKTIIVSIASVLLASACSPGAQTTASSASNPNATAQSGNSSSSTSPSSSTAASWSNVQSQTTGTVNGGLMDSYPLVQINPTAHTIELLIPFSFGLNLGSLTPILSSSVSIPALAGVTIGPVTLPDGSSGWAVSVPLKYLLKGGTGLGSLATLPDGTPLTSYNFPSEEVDGVSITLPQQSKYQVTLYVALKAVAVFVSVPGVNIPIGLGYQLVNSSQTSEIGYVALVPTEGTFPAGIFVSAQLPASVALELNSLVSF